ncbi:MAG: hypothetical protein ACYC0F_00240 [Rhodanobacter sp.]
MVKKIRRPRQHEVQKTAQPISKKKAPIFLGLDWSARVSLVSCVVSVIFGATTLWQASRHEERKVASAQADARSVAVTRVGELSMVDDYVVQTQLAFASALQKDSFVDAVASGAFERALSVGQSPSIEISLDEMHVIGHAYPDVEAAIARCKNAVEGMNRSKVDAQALLNAPPNEEDPDNSAAQVYLGGEIQMLPSIGKLCNVASDDLTAIASPKGRRLPLTSEIFAPVLVEMAKGQKYKLLDRPNGRYRFGPVLEKMASGSGAE